VLDAVEPAQDAPGIAVAEAAFGRFDEGYEALKQGLLGLGAGGVITVAEMDARLRAASALRRALVQAVDALRQLGSVRP